MAWREPDIQRPSICVTPCRLQPSEAAFLDAVQRLSSGSSLPSGTADGRGGLGHPNRALPEFSRLTGLVSLLLSQRAQDAELVALRVGHDHPSDVGLPDVDATRAETLQSFDLGALVVRAKVEVDSVLGRLVAVGRHQTKLATGAVRCGKEMSPRWSGPDVFEVERLTPERRHHVEVNAVDQHTFEDERHAAIVAGPAENERSRSAAMRELRLALQGGKLGQRSAFHGIAGSDGIGHRGDGASDRSGVDLGEHLADDAGGGVGRDRISALSVGSLVRKCLDCVGASHQHVA